MSHVSASKTLTVEELEAGRINRHENAFRCPTACSHSHYKGIRTVRVCHATSAITVQSPLAREANRERGRGRGVSLPTQHTTNTHQPTQRPNDPSTQKIPALQSARGFYRLLAAVGTWYGWSFWIHSWHSGGCCGLFVWRGWCWFATAGHCQHGEYNEQSERDSALHLLTFHLTRANAHCHPRWR